MAATSIDLVLAHTLVDCELGQRSGIVTAQRGKLKRLFCLQSGQLVFAASNLIEEQFDEVLLRAQLVTVGSLTAAREKNGQSLARALLDTGTVEASRLTSALADHVRELLFSTLNWPEGEVTLTRGTPNTAGELTVDLGPRELLADYARLHPARLDEVRARVGHLSTRLAVREEGAALSASLQMDAVAGPLLAATDGQRTIGEIVARSTAPEDASWRALYHLVLLGLVAPVTARAADGGESREQILGRLARARHDDHYSLLELAPTAPPERVREAYYRLARQYHPDRFRTGELAELLPQVEEYFTRVTEAYNTLQDPAARAAYDELRAETPVQEVVHDPQYLAKENFRMAKAQLARGRLKDAATSLENAVRLDPRNARYRFELGSLQARNPLLREQAEQQLLECNRLDPSLAEGYFALGDLYSKMGRHADAKRLFREVLRWDPTHEEATQRLGRS